MITDLEITDITSLPSLLIPERDNLPQSGGIYFVLTENNDIEYIGKARNFYKRWQKHECCMNLDSPKTCRVAWIEIVGEDERIEFERQFIRKFSPKCNSNLIIKPPKPKPIFVAKPAKVNFLKTGETFLKASEVAKRYDVTSYAVKVWIKNGLLPNARLEQSVAGSVWLIPESDLKDFQQPEMGRPKKVKKED